MNEERLADHFSSLSRGTIKKLRRVLAKSSAHSQEAGALSTSDGADPVESQATRERSMFAAEQTELLSSTMDMIIKEPCSLCRYVFLKRNLTTKVTYKSILRSSRVVGCEEAGGRAATRTAKSLGQVAAAVEKRSAQMTTATTLPQRPTDSSWNSSQISHLYDEQCQFACWTSATYRPTSAQLRQRREEKAPRKRRAPPGSASLQRQMDALRCDPLDFDVTRLNSDDDGSDTEEVLEYDDDGRVRVIRRQRLRRVTRIPAQRGLVSKRPTLRPAAQPKRARVGTARIHVVVVEMLRQRHERAATVELRQFIAAVATTRTRISAPAPRRSLWTLRTATAVTARSTRRAATTRAPSGCHNIGRLPVFAVATAVSKLYLFQLNSTKIEGAEILRKQVDERPAGTALITVSNHTATVDDPAVFASMLPWKYALPWNARWGLVSQEYSYLKGLPLRAFFYSAKALPIKRGAGIDHSMLESFFEKVQEGKWVHIFPEGKIEQRAMLGGRSGPRVEEIGLLKWGVGKLIARADQRPRRRASLPLEHAEDHAAGRAQPHHQHGAQDRRQHWHPRRSAHLVR
ncbi:hypothetical protein PINS_up020871 [Pythium insidiosum]|nr:hypothetical protein PINS_up020871 [Pythium insidiosum]